MARPYPSMQPSLDEMSSETCKVNSSGTWAMERNWQVGLQQRKIPVSGKYGDMVPYCYGADEKVGVGALDTLATTEVEKFGGCLVITGGQFKIGKCPQVIAEFLEVCLALYPGEKFLPDWSDNLNAHLSYQLE